MQQPGFEVNKDLFPHGREEGPLPHGRGSLFHPSYRKEPKAPSVSEGASSRTRQYVEKADRAERSQDEQIRRRVRNAGIYFADSALVFQFLESAVAQSRENRAVLMESWRVLSYRSIATLRNSAGRV